MKTNQAILTELIKSAKPGGHRMNTNERIESAVDALDNSGVDEPNEESGLTDLLTNLMHYADASDFDFDFCLRLARNHHRYETE